MAISESGLMLDQTLDDMDVENRWLSGKFVYWQTGITMPSAPPPVEGYEKDTHCSAFAAAVALRLGASLLSPPPEKFLANRQAEWLEALPPGWRQVSGPIEAQHLANKGFMVVISYFNPNPPGPDGIPPSGHIQVVRAHEGRSHGELEAVGPQISQAGAVNFDCTTASEGFASGYALSYPSYPWPKNVKYYAFALGSA
jgi:hypothetical protein